MRKSREQRTLRVKRETLRALTPLALGRVAGGSWGGDPDWDPTAASDACWPDPQSYTGGSRFC